jgi:hypothetical protein
MRRVISAVVTQIIPQTGYEPRIGNGSPQRRLRSSQTVLQQKRFTGFAVRNTVK